MVVGSVTHEGRTRDHGLLGLDWGRMADAPSGCGAGRSSVWQVWAAHGHAGSVRTGRVLAAIAVVVATSAVAVPIVSAGASSAASAKRPVAPRRDGLGIQPGKIKHVWLIILENKAYDATFTGLNKNTYLWRTLPGQGVLVKNYYGTGHFSFDNYLALVSGQATQPDTQADCPYYDHFSGHVDTSGSLKTNPNYGQMTSAQGAERGDRRPTAACTRRACRRCSSSSTRRT